VLQLGLAASLAQVMLTFVLPTAAMLNWGFTVTVMMCLLLCFLMRF
jgi:hypothetical protein